MDKLISKAQLALELGLDETEIDFMLLDEGISDDPEELDTLTQAQADQIRELHSPTDKKAIAPAPDQPDSAITETDDTDLTETPEPHQDEALELILNELQLVELAQRGADRAIREQRARDIEEKAYRAARSQLLRDRIEQKKTAIAGRQSPTAIGEILSDLGLTQPFSGDEGKEYAIATLNSVKKPLKLS